MAGPLEGRAPRLRPTARPVDTYVRPSVEKPPQKTGLMQLAESLSDVEPQIQKFLHTRHEGHKKAEIEKAKQARLKNQQSFAEAVKLYEKTGGKEGIAPGQSPYFIKEYKRMDGQLTARDQYRSFLHQKYQETGLAHNVYDSPAESAQAYENFVSQARNEFISQQGNAGDLEWLQGFEEERDSIESHMASTDLRERTKANEERFQEAVGSFVTSVIDSDTSMENKAALIEQDKDRKIGQFGMSGTDYNKRVVDAVSTRALSLAQRGRFAEAQEELELINKVKTGTGRLGGTSYAKEKITQTRNDIFQTQKQIEDYYYKQQDREEEEDREEATHVMLNMMLQDPTADISEHLQIMASDKNLSKVVPQIKELRSSLAELRFEPVEDPAEVTAAKYDVITGDMGPEEILHAVRNREFGSRTALSLLDEYDQQRRLKKNMNEMPKMHRSATEDLVSDVEGVIRGSDLAISDEETRRKATMATSLSRRLMAEWSINNPDASLMEVLEQSDKIRERILNNPRFKSELSQGSSNRWEAVPTTNPYEQFNDEPMQESQ